MTGWKPIDTAPKDGTWIVGFCGGGGIYVVMRWWDGILPDEDDDLTTDEEGGWISSDDGEAKDVTHWMSFEPHPSAPPKTVSLNNYDGVEGIAHPSRADRGITDDQIKWTRKFHEILSTLHMKTALSFEEISVMAKKAADEEFPGVKWESAA